MEKMEKINQNLSVFKIITQIDHQNRDCTEVDKIHSFIQNQLIFTFKCQWTFGFIFVYYFRTFKINWLDLVL